MGRYSLFDEVGHGGTATVHIGRWLAPGGFTKTVAVKRLHQNVARDAEVQAMFLDEARLASRIRHANVVAMLDLLALAGETFLVMEYVHGCSLSSLNRSLWERGERVPQGIASRVVGDALAGLAAAHAATSESGEPLGLIHRDVSPHNLQVGVDGVSRILDFGIAKALGRLQDTHTGQLKGKLAYMAPEQLLDEPVDQRADLFAAGVVLWETLAGRRLFAGDAPGQTVRRIVLEAAPPLRAFAPDSPQALCAVVDRAIARNPDERFASATEMLHALEAASGELASSRRVGAWLERVGGDALRLRSQRLREIESLPISLTEAAVTPPRTRITTGASASAEDVTRSDLRATFPSFSDVEPSPARPEVTLVDAIPESGIRRAPRGELRHAWWWAAAALGVFVSLGSLAARRIESPAAPPAAPVAALVSSQVVAAPAPTTTVAATPVVAPSAARPARRKAPPVVRRQLPRAEDLFSRH